MMEDGLHDSWISLGPLVVGNLVFDDTSVQRAARNVIIMSISLGFGVKYNNVAFHSVSVVQNFSVTFVWELAKKKIRRIRFPMS